MNVTPRTALLAAAIVAAACSRPAELPDMGVSRTALSFEAPGGSGEPAAQTFYVVNTGRGSLAQPTVQIAYDGGAGWLAATVAGSGAPYTVTVRPAVGALDPGVYGATLTVSCGNASSSPAQVHVALTVPDPRFTLSTAAVTFDAPRGGADPAPRSFQVLNAGRGTLPVPDVAISYVGASGWLSAAVSGTPDAYTVLLTPRVAGLDSGVYTATLSVGAAAAEGPPRTLTVTLNVPPAEVGLSTAALWFDGPADGSDPTPVAVAVANTGGGILDRPVATVAYEDGYAGPAWLEVTVTGDQAPYAIAVQPRQSHAIISIPTGTYVAKVQVTTADVAGAQSLQVTFRVPPPRIAFSNGASSVSLANIVGCVLPAPQTFEVTNAGAGLLARPTVTLSDPAAASWLSVVVSGDDVPYRVTLAVTARPPAAQTGVPNEVWLSFTAPGAPLAGKTVYYTEQTPSEYPTIAITPTTTALLAQDGAGDPVPQRYQVELRGFCSAALGVSVLYADGDPEWIQATATATAPDRQEVVMSPSVAGMSPGTRRDATLVVRHPEKSWVYASVPIAVTLVGLQPIESMGARRSDHTLTALANGNVLAIGGEDYAAAWSSETWVGYAWTPGPRLITGRYGGHGAALLADGDVLVCGGHLSGGGSEDRCEALHAGAFEARPPLTRGRQHPTLVPLPNGKVLVASLWDVVEIYDPSGGPSVVSDVEGASALKLGDGRVLVVGSSGRASTYDPATDAFTPAGAMAHAMSWPALAPLPDGGVLAVGAGPSAERWDPVTRAWRSVAPPLESHPGPEVAALEMGKVIAVGGPGGVVEVFDPGSETWSVAVSLPAERSWSSVVPLPSGRVVIAGGEEVTYPYASVSEAFIW